MFAATLHSVFDSIHSRLHEIIRTQVSTLPIIQSSLSSDTTAEDSCDEKIYKRISRVYSKHLDMAQLYAEKEIFCLDKGWNKSKREKIVHLFLELDENQQGLKLTTHDSGGGGEQDGEKDDHESCDQTSQQQEKENIVLRYKIPLSKNEIPTAEEFASLREEIKCLRQELRNYIVEKHRYHRQLQALEHVKESSAQVDESLSNKIGVQGQDGEEHTLNLVKEAMDGEKDLKNYIHHGKELIKEMDRMTQEKDASNETLEFSEVMKAKAMEVAQEIKTKGDNAKAGAQHKRTLEEDYKERKERIKIKGDVLKFFQK